MQQLDTESKQLANRNDSINESLRENEISVHKARTDAIELNRQQAETQERLQRIIAQKDEELIRFRKEAANSNSVRTGSSSTAGNAAGIAAGSAAAMLSRGGNTLARSLLTRCLQQFFQNSDATFTFGRDAKSRL